MGHDQLAALDLSRWRGGRSGGSRRATVQRAGRLATAEARGEGGGGPQREGRGQGAVADDEEPVMALNFEVGWRLEVGGWR